MARTFLPPLTKRTGAPDAPGLRRRQVRQPLVTVVLCAAACIAALVVTPVVTPVSAAPHKASSVRHVDPPIGALDSRLGAFVSGLGSQVGVVVYDRTHGTYYTYNSGMSFTMASSVKVPIMLTFLAQAEARGRGPNSQEMWLLTTMIENSNNNSAQALFNRIGGAAALAAYMRRIGVRGMRFNPNAWGYSTTTPAAMVSLLTLLRNGRILTTHDRSLAFFLMSHIERDQRIGVGDTAPAGASVAMKDGWVIGPDGMWATNSSGIVSRGRETYIISVYTHRDHSLANGWSVVSHVCGVVSQRLG